MPQQLDLQPLDLQPEPGEGKLDLRPVEKKGKKGPGFLGGVWRGLDPMPMLETAGAALGAPFDPAARQILRESFVDPLQAEAEKARATTGLSRFGHAVASGVPMLGPTAAELTEEFASGNIRGPLGTLVGMGVPMFGVKGLKRGAKAAGEGIYEQELRLPKSVPLEMRPEVVSRGLEPGKQLSFTRRNRIAIWQESKALKQQVTQLTKDPASPYSARSVPNDSIVGPIREYADSLAGIDDAKAKYLRKLSDVWEKKLGGPNGFASVSDVQQFKEVLDKELKSSLFGGETKRTTIEAKTAAQDIARGGAKTAIEKAIPEEPIAKLNRSIQRDIYLKDALTAALKRNPNWVNDWAVFAFGVGAEEFMRSIFAAGSFGEPYLGHAGMATMVGAVTRMAARNPRIMSSLAVALSKAGASETTVPKYPLIAAPFNVGRENRRQTE